MAYDAHANLAYTLLTNSPGTAGTTFNVTAGTGAYFPAAPFNCTVWPSGVIPTQGNGEIVRVTNVTGDVLTVTRAQEGSAAINAAAGYQLMLSITVADILAIETQSAIAGSAPASAQIAVGTSGSVYAPVTLSGDATITSAGAITVTSSNGSAFGSGAFAAAYSLPTASTTVLGGVKVDGTTVTISGGVISSTGGASGANPTATIGLTAVNGSAATFLRSDGAPALGVGITPTWTGAHIWTSGSTFQNALSVGGTAYSYGAPAVTGAPALLVPATTYTVTGSATTASFQANYFGIPTFTDASAGTVTDLFGTVFAGPAVAAGSLSGTRKHTLGILDSTSASGASTQGAFVVATTFGTAATSVSIGAGYVNAGTAIVGGGITLLSNAIFGAGTTLPFTVNGSSAATFTKFGIQLGLQGTNSSASWLTSGLFFSASANIGQNLSAAGTYASAVFSSFAQPTLTAFNASTFTTLIANAYIAGAPIIGTNQASTASTGKVAALYIDNAANIASSGTVPIAASLMIAGAPTSAGTITNSYAVYIIGGTTYHGGSVQFSTTGASAPSTSSVVLTTTVYGSNTAVLTTPTGWMTILDSGGTARVVPYY